MFKEMRRSEKQMSMADAMKTVTEAEYGMLASIGDNGYPYCVPLNFAYAQGQIYFHSAIDGHKTENIRSNNKVSFTVVNYHQLMPDRFDTEYDSAVMYGRAAEVTDQQEKRDALMLLIEKYAGDFREQGQAYIEKSINAVAVFKIQIEHLTGKLGR